MTDARDGDNDEEGEGFIEKGDFIVFPLHFNSMQCKMKSENVKMINRKYCPNKTNVG